MAVKHDRFAHFTLTDLQMIARARKLTVPADADRTELVALLRADEAPARTSEKGVVAKKAARKVPVERPGWWTSLSVSELRNNAREHGIDVPAGLHRQELVDLLIEHDVPRPSRPPSRTPRRSN